MEMIDERVNLFCLGTSAGSSPAECGVGVIGVFERIGMFGPSKHE
jgi:hypothetical protein